jgi:AcrR family transcriptional regulator
MPRNANGYLSKKRELVTTAEKLFIEKGYKETTIDDLLDASSLSKGGFYHYFSSKEEVLEESIKVLMESLLEQILPIVEDDSLTAMQKLRMFFQKKNEYKEPKNEVARYISKLLQSDFAIYKYYLVLAQSYVEPLAKIIEQGAKEGTFSVTYPWETADILVRAVTSFPQSALMGEYLQDEERLSRYSFSVNEVIAKVLGIEPKELTS